MTLRRSSVTDNTAAEDGGGIAMLGDDTRLTLYDSLVDGNYATDFGGGISSRSGTVVLRGATVSNNAVANRFLESSECYDTPRGCRGRGGGIFILDADLSVLEGSTVSDNSASVGGGIRHYGISNTVIHGSTVARNSASSGGGGVFAQSVRYPQAELPSGTLTVVRSAIADNFVATRPDGYFAYSYGAGGISIHGVNATVQESLVSGNRHEILDERWGGGIGVSGGSQLTALDSVITGNWSSGRGGGVFSYGDLILDDVVISNNSAAKVGGGAHLAGASQLIGTRVFNNTSLEAGGGLTAWGETQINGAEVYQNTAPRGGGIQSYGQTTVANSSIYSNEAERGGGLLVGGGEFEIATSTIFGNTAEQDGGGAAFEVSSASGLNVSSIRNVTFSGNVATFGGGLAIVPLRVPTTTEFRDALRIVHSTFVDNLALSRANDLWWQDALPDPEVFVANTIFAGTEVGEACGLPGSTLTENISNFYADGSCGTNGVDTVTDNLIVGPLADNGGPTRTHAVDPGSDTVDAAASSRCQPTDQRGVPRDPEVCDIGAFEVTEALKVGTASLAVDPNDGNCSLLEAIRNANNDDAFSTNPGECAPGVANAFDRIELPAGAAYDFGDAAGDNAALPEIMGLTEIIGHGATLRRTSPAPFRLLHNKGSLRLRSMNVENFESQDRGGAILNEGDLELTNVTLRDSAADQGGGAIANASGASLSLVNSTLSGNKTGQSGGAVLNETDAEATLRHTTLAFNDASGEGAALASFGALSMENSLIVGSNDSGAGGTSSQAADCFIAGDGAFVTNVGNLVQDGSCSAQFSGGSDPLIEPLADNGGLILTHALVTENNLAIDNGSEAACADLRWDSRGEPFERRVDGNGDGLAQCDIGAFEFTRDTTPDPDIIFASDFE